MFDKISDIWNSIKSHPNITFLIICLFLGLPIMGICESISLWNEHPIRFVCKQKDDKCKLITYNYEHKICWDYIFSSYSKYSSKRIRTCKLPRYSSFEKELLSVQDIANFLVKERKKRYYLYAIDKKGEIFLLHSYKNQDTTEFVLNKLQKQLYKYKNPTYRTNIYGEYVPESNDIIDYFIN